ncbi:MAG: pyridoxamine 5'-phosphate oxidase family protein [Chloroflexota bacterium]
MIWRDFEAAAPELARVGRGRFEATRVALLGTVRRDGSPRISPVEPYFVNGELLFGVMRSAKGVDLERDPRCALHSSVSDPNGSEGEFKLSGRAVLVSDAALRDARPDTWWNSFPVEAATVYSLDVESAAFVGWNFENMTYELTRWSQSAGVSKETAAYP